MKLAVVAVSMLFGARTLIGPQASDQESYANQIETWRKAQEADLKKPEGWLSVAGLVWLKSGVNAVGSGGWTRVQLPKPAPATLGTLTLKDGHVSLQVTTASPVLVNGVAAKSGDLKSDADGGPDRVSIGSVTMTIIKRGSRTGVRIFDPNSKARRGFTGEKWFPVDSSYRIRAKFIAYDPVKTMPITNVLGDVRQAQNPGFVEFSIRGHQCRLEAESAGSGLFFNFRDSTSGRSTYGAGRFLDAPAPKDGFVDLDFNRATNPPCAFTNFATCPLPPTGNQLSVSILAGEKTYHVAGGH